MIAPTLQRLALCFLLLCSVVVPAAAAEVAANVLVGMLASANIGAGVPAGWPRAQRRVEDAKMLLDVEKVKMLPWQIGLLNRKLGTQAGLEQRCLRGGGQAPEGSMNLWLGPLLVLITVVFGFRLIRSRSRCFRQSDQESPLEVGGPEASYSTCPARPQVLPKHRRSSKRLVARGMPELLLSRYKQSRCKGSTFGRTVLVCLTQPLCHGHTCGATPGSCCCPGVDGSI